MNARDIAIALTGRAAAEKSLRSALLAQIEAEAHVLARHASARIIPAEAEYFHKPYGWEGVRNFGETVLRIENREPIEIADASLSFQIAPGGFLIVPDLAEECEIYLTNEVVEIASRGDVRGMIDYVEDMVRQMLEARRVRVENVRLMFERVERTLPLLADDEREALIALSTRANSDNGRFTGSVELYNRLLMFGCVDDLDGYPVLTTLGTNLARRLNGSEPVMFEGARGLAEARGD